MRIKKIAPVFRYQLTNPNRHDYGVISADGMYLHKIQDVGLFYATLGYTQAMNRDGVEPEVFVWMEYSKDKCKKSYACLQEKIVSYLKQYSTEFMEAYGKACEGWVETCDQPITHAEDCTACSLQHVAETTDSES